VTDEVLADQVDYYRRRAGEYDVRPAACRHRPYVAVARRRAARARSARTATVAASSVAPTAIKMIGQPSVPPAMMVRTGTWAGTGP
jgi:hypothetical protein